MSHTTAQQPGSGTVISYGASPTGTWTPFPLVTDIDLPNSEQAEVDTTLLASTYMSSDPNGVPDLGEITLTYRWDPADASHMAILADVQGTSGTRYWQVTYADIGGTKEVYQCWSKKFERGTAKIGSKLEGKITLRVRAVPTSSNAGT